MTRLTVLCAFGAIALLFASDAAAQRLTNRRVPMRDRRPAISPYTNLFQGNNAGLNSYYDAYRPRQRTLEFASETVRELQFQRDMMARDTMSLRREIQDTTQKQEEQPRGMLQMRPTGSGAQGTGRQAADFMNYSRYFPQAGVARRGR